MDAPDFSFASTGWVHEPIPLRGKRLDEFRWAVVMDDEPTVWLRLKVRVRGAESPAAAFDRVCDLIGRDGPDIFSRACADATARIREQNVSEVELSYSFCIRA